MASWSNSTKTKPECTSVEIGTQTQSWVAWKTKTLAIPTSKESAAIPKIVIFNAYKLNDLYHDLNLVIFIPIEEKSYKKGN